MSDISSTSYNRDNSCNNKCDSGFSPMILILLLLCSGGNGLFGGDCYGNQGSCGITNDMGGILPLILILTLCGGGGGCLF